MIGLLSLEWNVWDFLLAVGMIGVFGYLLLYIIEAVSSVDEEHYTEYEENEHEIRRSGTDSE